MSTPNNCTNDLTDLLVQKQQRQIFNSNRQLRFQLQSPYTHTTTDDGMTHSERTAQRKHELDQRRKAEILKYNKNGGKQSRRMAYAAISQRTRQNPNNICAIGPKTLSASNVPKDRHNPSVQTLILDPTIELYNYLPRTDPFPSDETEQIVSYRFHKDQNKNILYTFDSLRNEVAKTTYSMTTDVRIGYLEFNELVDSEISTVQIDLDVYLQFVDISLGTVGAVEKYDITFPSIQDQVKPLHLYFSDRNVDNTITYNHTTYTPSVMGISNELISPHINGTYTHDIPVRIQTILDIPSVNGYIYELRASFKTVDINPQFKNSTRVSLLTGQNDVNVTVLVP